MAPKVKTATKPDSFFRIFFIIFIIYEILSLIDTFFITGRINILEVFQNFSLPWVLWFIFLALFYVVVFVLNVIALVRFTKKRFPKITLVVPIIFFIATVFSVLLSFLGISFTEEGFANPLILAFGAIIDAFLLGFSIFVLLKYWDKIKMETKKEKRISQKKMVFQDCILF